MSKLKGAVLGGIVILFGLYLFVGFTEIPVAVVCDRGRPNVEVSSTAYRGHFEENRIDPCVTYTQRGGD